MYSSSSRDIPKSDILTVFSNPMRQFRAAKSRWMQFFDSKYRIPGMREKIQLLSASHFKLSMILHLPAAASLHIPINCFVFSVTAFFRRKLSNEPPGTNSMTIIIGCFCTQMPINFTIFGWSYCFNMRPSCKNFRFCSSGNVMRHVFTATSFLFDFNRALYTSPKLPWRRNRKYWK